MILMKYNCGENVRYISFTAVVNFLNFDHEKIIKVQKT